MDNLNKPVDGKPEAEKTLEDIIKTSEGGVFNNAAQIWKLITVLLELDEAGGGGQPTGDLAQAITRDFGSYEKFAEEFTTAGMTQFGSGWSWLVLDKGKLAVTKTPNADLPMKHVRRRFSRWTCGSTPITSIFRNARPKYIETFLKSLANPGLRAREPEGGLSGLPAPNGR